MNTAHRPIFRRLLSVVLAGGLMSLSVLAAGADPVHERTAAGDPRLGHAKAQSAVCQECHGAEGNSLTPDIPRLAGQYSQYLLKQLQDFRSGARRHVVMQALAQDMGDGDMADLAAHFASFAPLPGDGRTDALGQRLFQEGDSARGLPACAGCHGTDGRGQRVGATAFPALGGQHRFYLRGQLQDWRNGIRVNSPDQVMNSIAARLGDADIEALAEYLSGL